MTELWEAASVAPPTGSDVGPNPIERLTRRRQFLDVAKGKRVHTSAFTLQAAPRATTGLKPVSPSTSVEGAGSLSGIHVTAPDSRRGTAPRFGITVTKKIGGAVERNRIRRRLREALRGLVPLPARAGHDYVIVARGEALRLPFALLAETLAKAFVRIDRESPKAGTVPGCSDRLPRGNRLAPDSNRGRPRKDRTGKAP